MSLLNLDSLTKEEIISLIKTALKFKSKELEYNFNQEKIMVNLFFENSTRTHYSFEMAAKRLGVQTINFSPSSSSLNKGESFEDTIKTFISFKPDLLVIRDSNNRYYDKIDTEIPIVNGGDGNYSHPTQSLLDLMTIYENFSRLDGLKVLICGDIKHSRVAHSNYKIMKKLDMDVKFTCPVDFRSDFGEYVDIDENLNSYDVVMLLRTQIERHAKTYDISDFNKLYGFNDKRLGKLKKESIIMHPAPFNMNVELTQDVIDDKRCKIFEQSENGVYMRMAVIKNELLSN